MNKSLAIAVSLCFVVLFVSDVDAGIFGRRSSCRGGNCNRYSVPSKTKPATTPVTVKKIEVTSDAAEAETKTTATNTSVTAKSISQPAPSPSDLSIPQAAASSPTAAWNYFSSPCANGRCYRRR